MKKLAIAIFLAFAVLIPTTQALEINIEYPKKVLFGKDVPINLTIKNDEGKNLTNLNVELFDNGKKFFNDTISLNIGEEISINTTLKNLNRGVHNITLKVNGTMLFEKYLRVVYEQEYEIILAKNFTLVYEETEITIFIENNGNKTLTNLEIEVFDDDREIYSYTISIIKAGENFTKKISFKPYTKGVHTIKLKVNGIDKAEKKLNVISLEEEKPKIDLNYLYIGLIILFVLLLIVVIKKFKLFKMK